jgi:hypothetical protein
LAYATAEDQLVSPQSNGGAVLSDTIAKPVWLADHLIDPEVHIVEAVSAKMRSNNVHLWRRSLDRLPLAMNELFVAGPQRNLMA